MCGGTFTSPIATVGKRGLSPRVRGNQGDAIRHLPDGGSIPACAGEPWTAKNTTIWKRVYPRVCGGTTSAETFSREVSGLSPRVRGNLSLRNLFIQSMRSIPACAGEPPPAGAFACPARVYPRVCGEPDGGFSRGPFSTVYPRVCGGTNLYECGECGELGLSPRVRGNPPPVMADQPADGSIPACAGEPHSTNARLGQARVYPRVCGGTCNRE